MNYHIGAAINGIFFLLMVWGFIRVINDKNNKLEWYQLVSDRAQDGKPYASWNKIGQGFGVMVAVWMPFLYVHSDKMDAGGLSMIMGVSLLYLGGVSSYSLWMRSKSNVQPKDESVLK